MKVIDRDTAVNALLATGKHQLTAEQRELLKKALSVTGGAIRLNGAAVLVALAPLSPTVVLPTCYVGPLSRTREGTPAFITTIAVAYAFREHSRGLPKERPEGYQKSWVPRPTKAFSLEPLNGTLQRDKPVAISPDPTLPGSRYEWFDISEVPAGGCLYRIAGDGTVQYFWRVARKWVRLTHLSPAFRGVEASGRLAQSFGPFTLEPDNTPGTLPPLLESEQ